MNSNFILTVLFTICAYASIFHPTMRYSVSARKLLQTDYNVTSIRGATDALGGTRSMCATKQGNVFVLTTFSQDSIYVIDSSTDIGNSETISEAYNVQNPWTLCMTVDEVAYILPDNADNYVICTNSSGSYECEAHELAYKITDCVRTDLGNIYCICGTCDTLIEFQTTNSYSTRSPIGFNQSVYSKSVWVPHKNAILVMPASVNAAFVLVHLDVPIVSDIEGYKTVQANEFIAMAYHNEVQRGYVVSILSESIGVIDVNQLMYYSIESLADGDSNIKLHFTDVVVARNGLVYCAPYDSNSALILHPNNTNAGEEVYETLQVFFDNYIKIIDTDMQKLYMVAPQYGVTIVDYSDSTYTLVDIPLDAYGTGWSSVVFFSPDSVYVGTGGSAAVVKVEYQDTEPTQPESSSSPQPSTQPESSSSTKPSTQPESSLSPQPSTQPESSSSPQPSTQPESSSSTQPSTQPESSLSPQPSTQPESSSSSPQPTPAAKESGAQFAHRSMKTVSKHSKMCQNTNSKHTQNETYSTMVSF